MQQIEGTFPGVRNAEIYYQGWLPDSSVKAVLLLVHGLGEHSGRYVNHVHYFVPKGYAVYALDHLGHGKSAGEREVIDRFTDYTETLAIFHRMVREWQPEQPLFILGHSMGGLITCAYLLDHQSEFAGAILSAPAVKVSDDIPAMTITAGRLLSKLMPKAGVLALDEEAISRDPLVVQAYADDPLNFHGKTPARLAAEMLNAMQRVGAQAHKITLPFILVQGTADKLVDPSGAQMLYEKASSQDKTLKLYPGLYHEIHNEPEREEMFRGVEEWLATRIETS
jgi:acylglycerol lipase